MFPVKGTLDTGKAGTVIDLDKDQVLHFPPGSDPAANFYFLGPGRFREHILDELRKHGISIPQDKKWGNRRLLT
jgi:hypothetical protein